jgi:hypothetical protein
MELIGWLFLALLVVIPLWAICAKVGLPPFLSLVAVVPGIGFLIVLAVLAFAGWPNARQAEG